jgi:hypothetical protein
MSHMPIDFIHIGLGKCASTYLQNVFKNQPDYSIVDLKGVVEAIHENARQGSDPQQFPKINININRPADHKYKKFTIASDEDFSFISEPKHYECIKHLHGLSAHFLGKAQLSSKILLMIRNPMEWLRAAHEQSIKGGRFESYNVFFKKEKSYLKNSLDIKEILSSYSNFFEVITLAAENLRKNPDDYWELYSEKLGVTAPKKELLVQLLGLNITGNSSLKDRSLKLAALNKFSSIKLECLQALGDYNTYMVEESKTNILYCQHERWSNRRMVEFASDEQLNKLTSILDGFNAENFTNVYIDNEMKDHLLEHFMKPLEKIDTIPDELKETYIKSIEKAAI